MNNEISALRSELALLKLQFSERVNQVDARLNSLIAQENLQSNAVSNTATHKSNIQDEQFNKQNLAAVDDRVAGVNGSSIKPHEQINTAHHTSNAIQQKNNKQVSQKPAKPLAITLFLESFVQTLIKTIIATFFEWCKPVIGIYKSYQEKGMLGIFVLTIVGITLVLAGFGYLMQLLIDQLGSGAKSLLMCLAALLVIGVGIGLKIKTTFSEFATAIVTLGVLLSYCTIYFAGSVYGIIPNIIVLICYFFIALTCHGLAKWLNTKIVASLGIIGIATMPILSNTVQIEPLYYLLSLAFVVVSSLIFAFKTNEKWLANLTLVFTLVSVEWVISVEGIQLSAWAVNLFYILFFIYATVALFTHKKPYKNNLLFIAALVGTTVLMFFQASELFSTQMSLAFMANMLLATATAILFYKVKHEVTPFIILLSALWGVLAIISAVSNAYWGIAWAIEGLLLLYVGRKYLLSFVSNQGQALLAISLIYSWVAIAPYFPLPALTSISGWVLSIAIVLVIATWQRMITSKGFDLLSQNTIKPVLQLVEVVWGSVLIIACSHIWLGVWTGVAAIILQALILFRGRFCKQLPIEILAVLLVFIPVFYVYQGALLIDPLINTYRFSALPLFAKLAVISVFAQLWLWSAFYRKYHPNSPIKKIAEATRILFYLLIPICWISSAFRKLDENVLLILWLSPAIALFFAQKIKHKFIEIQAKVLTVLTSVCFFIIIGQLTLINSVLGIAGFIAFYSTSYLLNKKSASSIYTFICGCGLISLGFALPNAIGFHTDSLLMAMLAGSIYWAGCLVLIKRSVHMNILQIPVYVINCLLVAASWVLIHFDPLYAVVPVLFLAVMTYHKHYFSGMAFMTRFTRNNSHLLLHSVGVITYLSLLSSLYQYRLELLIAPVLAIHGATILFMKNRHLTTIRYSFALIILGIVKLALIDANNALLWQKVMLFMGIGLFILAASFWYQKLVKRMAVIDHAKIKNDSPSVDE